MNDFYIDREIDRYLDGVDRQDALIDGFDEETDDAVIGLSSVFPLHDLIDSAMEDSRECMDLMAWILNRLLRGEDVDGQVDQLREAIRDMMRRDNRYYNRYVRYAEDRLRQARDEAKADDYFERMLAS